MANTSKTEEYNGTSWSTANDMTAHKEMEQQQELKQQDLLLGVTQLLKELYHMNMMELIGQFQEV